MIWNVSLVLYRIQKASFLTADFYALKCPISIIKQINKQTNITKQKQQQKNFVTVDFKFWSVLLVLYKIKKKKKKTFGPAICWNHGNLDVHSGPTI